MIRVGSQISNQPLDAFFLEVLVGTWFGLAPLSPTRACQVHIWSSLPLHPKTSKVNRQELLADLARRKSRELAWTAKLKEVQKKMIKGARSKTHERGGFFRVS